MFWTEILIAFSVAALLGAIFTLGFGRSGPWQGWIWFFVILFFGTWALGTWFRPVGPLVWNVTWVPFVVAGVLVALLLAAASPPERWPPRLDRPVRDVAKPSEPLSRHSVRAADDELAAGVAIGAFFWIAIVAAIAAITWRYFQGQDVLLPR